MTRLIGLTGGIGCGKTEVARIWKALGAVVIDADMIGREVVQTDERVRMELRSVFGDRFFNKNGSLRRSELGHYVFADDARKKQLNAIVHPHLWRRLRKEVEEAVQKNVSLVVVDAALIYETGLDAELDTVVVVESLLENRVVRLRRRDGFSDDEIRARIRSQIPLEDQIRKASVVISNNGTLSELKEKATEVFQGLLR